MNSQNSGSCKSLRSQAGLSLIELLVAIAIGLFLLLGLGAVFLNMRQAFAAQDQLAQLQDSERLALTVLTTTIQSAGYYPDPTTHTRESALPESGSFAAGQGIFGANDKSGDFVSVRYLTRAGDGLMNCLGQTNSSGANAEMSNVLWVSDGALQCSTDGGITKTELVGNVRSMQVLYGAATEKIGVDRYLSAAGVQASSSGWPSVKTVRLTLMFENPFKGQAGQTSDTVQWTQVINLMNTP